MRRFAPALAAPVALATFACSGAGSPIAAVVNPSSPPQ